MRTILNTFELTAVGSCCFIELLLGHNDIIRDAKSGKESSEYFSLALKCTGILALNWIGLVYMLVCLWYIAYAGLNYDSSVLFEIASEQLAGFILIVGIQGLLGGSLNRESKATGVKVIVRTSALANEILKKVDVEVPEEERLTVQKALSYPVVLTFKFKEEKDGK